MSSAELSEGLLSDDYEAIEEEWEDPVTKVGKKKLNRKMTTVSEVDRNSVFQQG
jgi:hypothetical protein